MMIKKEDHNTGVSNGIEKFLMENLIENFKKRTKNLKNLAIILKTVLFQGT